MPGYWPLDSFATLCRDSSAIHELSRSANAVMLAYSIPVFCLVLVHLKDVEECHSVAAANSAALKRMHIVVEIAAASFAGCTFEKIHMVCQRDDLWATFELEQYRADCGLHAIQWSVFSLI